MRIILHWVFPLSTWTWWKFLMDGGVLQWGVVTAAVVADIVLAPARITLGLVRCAERAGRWSVSMFLAMLYAALGVAIVGWLVGGIARTLLHPLFMSG